MLKGVSWGNLEERKIFISCFIYFFSSSFLSSILHLPLLLTISLFFTAFYSFYLKLSLFFFLSTSHMLFYTFLSLRLLASSTSLSPRPSLHLISHQLPLFYLLTVLSSYKNLSQHHTSPHLLFFLPSRHSLLQPPSRFSSMLITTTY